MSGLCETQKTIDEHAFDRFLVGSPSMAYVLLFVLRRVAPRQTLFDETTCGPICLKPLKIGAPGVTACGTMLLGLPHQREFARAHPPADQRFGALTKEKTLATIFDTR